MIKVTVMYPYGEGKRFDIDYYCNKHIPMVKQALGAACKGVSVDYGLGGGEPGTKPAFIAIAELLFDSVESFQAAFGPHLAAFLADGPNYTEIAPELQLSQVKL